MNPTQYQTEAARTESSINNIIENSGQGVRNIRLIHALLGLDSETGELADAVKRHLFYGKPLDEANLKEELGDVMWYVALACNALYMDLGEVMAANIRKLRARYPERFTNEQANARDTAAEQAAMDEMRNTIQKGEAKTHIDADEE